MSEIDKTEQEWVKEQIRQFQAVRPRYKRYAEVLREVLEQAARKYAPLGIVQARPKAVPSFAEKIQRKRAKYTDAVKDITDLCGARVITHTRAQVETMCKFITENFEIDWENCCDISQRHRPSEFGYMSVHYVVLFKPEGIADKNIDVEIPESVLGLKAEIQVRTLLQHAWADISHDLSYKREIKIPDKWEREFAEVAAILESADNAFCRIEEELRTYVASYGAYMSEEQMRDEIDKLELVLEYDKDNPALAARIGKLAITLGDWDKAIEALSAYADTEYQPALRDLGVAMCKKQALLPIEWVKMTVFVQHEGWNLLQYRALAKK